MPVSTRFNVKVCDFESVLPKQDKILSTKDRLWQTASCFFPSQANNFGTWDNAQLDTLEAPALQLPEYSISFCCTQNQGREQLLHVEKNL